MERGEQAGNPWRHAGADAHRVRADAHPLVADRESADDDLAGPHLAPVLVALVRLESRPADAERKHLGHAHRLANRRQVRGQVRRQGRRPGVRGEEDGSRRDLALRRREAREPTAGRAKPIDAHAGHDRSAGGADRVEQREAEAERVEVGVLGRPLRGANGARCEPWREVAKLGAGDDADLEALPGLKPRGPADALFLVLVGRKVERTEPIPLDSVRQLGVPCLEHVERAHRVVEDRAAARLLHEPGDPLEVITHAGHGDAGVSPRRAPGRGVGLDDQRAHSRPREVVGGRGSEHAAPDDDHLRRGRQLRARVGNEGDQLRRRSEDRRGWGHTGAERTIGRCHAPRRFAFARARSRSAPR